jgi:hypothetical protein
MSNLPIGRNESVCDVYSSCWPSQAQDAATVAPTHQDTLNPWIPIPENIGFFKLTKATTPHSIVMSETAAPFANPSNEQHMNLGKRLGILPGIEHTQAPRGQPFVTGTNVKVRITHRVARAILDIWLGEVEA